MGSTWIVCYRCVMLGDQVVSTFQLMNGFLPTYVVDAAIDTEGIRHTTPIGRCKHGLMTKYAMPLPCYDCRQRALSTRNGLCHLSCSAQTWTKLCCALCLLTLMGSIPSVAATTLAHGHC